MSNAKEKQVNKGGRPKKNEKGKNLWIPANAAKRVDSLLKLINCVAEYEKQLSTLKNPSDKLIQALKEEFYVYGSVEALRVIDGLLFGSIDIETAALHLPRGSLAIDTQRTEPTPMAKPEYEQNDFIEVIDPQPDSTVSAPATLPESTHGAPKTKQPEPKPVKSVLTQAEWIEPTQEHAHSGYDGTAPLKEALETLYKKKLICHQVAAMTEQALSALGIVRGADKSGSPSLIQDAPTRLRIYQWHANHGVFSGQISRP